MAIGLAIIFMITLVIGTGVVFSIRNVNVAFVDYSGKYAERFETVKSNLNNLKGSGLIFVSDSDIYGKIEKEDLPYIAIEGYEKKFPCTVNVTVRERVECFALRTAEGYSVYDDRGALMRKTESAEVPLNPVDGSPDLRVIAAADEMTDIARVCGYFKDNFGNLRRLAESAVISKYLELNVLTVNMRSGLQIRLYEWKNSPEEKIKKAYGKYVSLSDAEKLSGAITVVDGGENGSVSANYTATE